MSMSTVASWSSSQSDPVAVLREPESVTVKALLSDHLPIPARSLIFCELFNPGTCPLNN